MTLFFNIDNLTAEAKGDPDKMLNLLYRHYYGLPPKKTSEVPKRKLTGKSYLLNPEPILSRPKGVDILFLIQYIKLAARRDYSLYKMFKVKTLPLSYYPDLNLQAIKQNPLLNIINNELTFYYE